MKKIALLLLLAFPKMQAQDTIYYPKVDDFRRMYFELGIVQPQGNLANKFDKATRLGVWFRNKIKRNQFIDIGLEVDLLVKPRQVGYNFHDSIIKLESAKSGLKIGLRYSRIFPLSKKDPNFNLETNTGLGWSSLYYSVPDHYKQELIDRLDKKTNLHTVFLSQTLKFNLYDFGVFCTYSYTPHTLFTHHYEADFGSQSVAVGLVYRF